jgi:hypothetical protein
MAYVNLRLSYFVQHICCNFSKDFKARNTWCYVKNNVGYSWEYLFVWLNSTFLSEQTSHQQPASSTFLSEQISISYQPNEPVVLFSQNKSASATSQTSQ